MSEPPPPDLMDSAGRLRRLALALIIGASAGALAYFLANTLIAPEQHKYIVTSRQMSRDTFVIYVGLIAAFVSFTVAVMVQNRLAKTKWKSERVPRAKIH